MAHKHNTHNGVGGGASTSSCTRGNVSPMLIWSPFSQAIFNSRYNTNLSQYLPGDKSWSLKHYLYLQHNIRARRQ